MMTRSLGRAVLGLGLTATLAAGQVITKEQDTTMTGPRGRTIERDIKVQRGPGIRRPPGRDQAARRDHDPRYPDPERIPEEAVVERSCPGLRLALAITAVLGSSRT